MLKNRTVQFLFFKYLFISFLVAGLIIPAICLADADKLFKENSKAVVVVITYGEKGNPISQGSGFIVRTDGAVVTNYHVISNARNIKVKAGEKVLDVEGLIYVDKENDLVILKVKGEGLPTVKLGDIGKIAIGEKVYVISSPQGLENTISDGILSGIRKVTPELEVLQITAPVSSGSSGGPVFNKDGEVIGIATFLIKEAQNLNFAMPVNIVKDKIGSKKVIALKDSEIEDYKKTAEYWFYLGVAYSDSDMWREAMESFKQAIRIKPDYAEAHNNLGISYDNLGMYKEAIEAYKQAIRIKPDDAEAHNNLGVSYDKLGMYKEAIEAFKQAIRIKPDVAEAHYNLGAAYHNLGMYKEAIESYKQAIRIKPDYADAHYGLGISYGKLGMYKEAIESYKQAIRIKPDDAEAHLNLGVSYAKLGMYRESIEACLQAIRIKPDYADAHYGLGVIYFIFNDRGSALEQYKILKDLDPEKANELFNLIYK
jgi:tetratricopeptide (TPR) repeat protein